MQSYRTASGERRRPSVVLYPHTRCAGAQPEDRTLAAVTSHLCERALLVLCCAELQVGSAAPTATHSRTTPGEHKGSARRRPGAAGAGDLLGAGSSRLSLWAQKFSQRRTEDDAPRPQPSRAQRPRSSVMRPVVAASPAAPRTSSTGKPGKTLGRVTETRPAFQWDRETGPGNTRDPPTTK